jgi:hypothetical protein
LGSLEVRWWGLRCRGRRGEVEEGESAGGEVVMVIAEKHLEDLMVR